MNFLPQHADAKWLTKVLHWDLVSFRLQLQLVTISHGYMESPVGRFISSPVAAGQ